MEQKILNKIKEKNNGITLIALVITIIVLLILAGVSIATLTGQNGILTQAQTAKENTELASEKEGIELAAQSSMTKNPDTLEITKINLDEGIREQLGNNREFETTDNKDGSFIVNLKNPNRMYYVDETGKVIPEENMKKISTADELKAFRDDVNSGNTYEGWYVYLSNDITLDISEEWIPIANYSDIDMEQTVQFDGIFDGKNYKILELYINKDNDRYQGLFGCNIGNVKNVIVSTNSYVKGKGNTGSIVGYNIGTILNCINQGTVQSNYNNAGGIVGKNEGYIRNCRNEGRVESSSQATGGVVGWNCLKGIVENSYNNSNVISEYQMTGGVVGSNDGLVRKCYNLAEVQTSSYTVGGIVGQNYGKIEECFNERQDCFYWIFYNRNSICFKYWRYSRK